MSLPAQLPQIDVEYMRFFCVCNSVTQHVEPPAPPRLAAETEPPRPHWALFLTVAAAAWRLWAAAVTAAPRRPPTSAGPLRRLLLLLRVVCGGRSAAPRSAADILRCAVAVRDGDPSCV